jgi:hypothetical protein
MSHIPERSVARPRISIVVPALNEARNLEVVLPELPPVYEVILVDGTSTDGTVETALRVLPTVKIVKQTRRGKGNALVCGFEAASGDVVVMFDADGSADPAEIHRFVEALRDGADFAKGSRALEAGGSQDITVLRSWGNRVMTSITNLLFRTGYTDLCYGYNTFWRDVLGLLDLPSPTAGTRVWGTASRSRPCSTAGSRPRASSCARWRASSVRAYTARATSTRSATGCVSSRPSSRSAGSAAPWVVGVPRRRPGALLRSTRPRSRCRSLPRPIRPHGPEWATSRPGWPSAGCQASGWP